MGAGDRECAALADQMDSEILALAADQISMSASVQGFQSTNTHKIPWLRVKCNNSNYYYQQR
jgi:hypothetical protein